MTDSKKTPDPQAYDEQDSEHQAASANRIRFRGAMNQPRSDGGYLAPGDGKFKHTTNRNADKAPDFGGASPPELDANDHYDRDYQEWRAAWLRQCGREDEAISPEDEKKMVAEYEAARRESRSGRRS